MTDRNLTGTFINGRRIELSRLLGFALTEAENLFGSRDSEWSIMGVDICANSDNPNIFYPNTGTKHVLAQLGQSVCGEDQACYQLSHEVIHLLNPTERASVSVLEEGVATWFSEHFTGQNFPDYPASPGLASYQNALDLTRPLMADPAPLRQWRADHPGRGFSDITATELQTLYPLLGTSAADTLTSRFERELEPA